MDCSTELDGLQPQVAHMKSGVQAGLAILDAIDGRAYANAQAGGAH